MGEVSGESGYFKSKEIVLLVRGKSFRMIF